MDDMKEALIAIEKLQQANGAKEKHRVMVENADNEEFSKLLYYAFNPRLTYKVSEATLSVEGPHPHRHIFENFFEVCETLAARAAVTDELLHSVIAWIEDQKFWHWPYYKQILAKTLRCGVTAKSINKAISGLIPEWEVQQAYPIEKHPLKEGTWFAVTQKLNGVRCTYYRGELIGRSGEPFTGLDHIADELSAWSDLVLDGELTLKDKENLSDNEAFRTATGIINSDSGDKSRICFTIFDVLPADEFDEGGSYERYSERRARLGGLATVLKMAESVSVLPVLYVGNDQSKIEKLLDQMVAEDKEGLMVNLDAPYKCKRHSGILKVKRFYTMDLPIIRIEEGSGKYAGTTGALIVDYKGNEVGVGTGLTDEQRRFFWEFRDTYVGVLAEIKYKEISSDKKTGAESLQFPVFVRLRTDKNEVSFG